MNLIRVGEGLGLAVKRQAAAEEDDRSTNNENQAGEPKRHR